jgi:carboxypeptidase C (cathepsin A)
MFGQFIRNYLDKYNRWASPKYLFGESYGTFRSAGLASELQSSEGIELNGIMLLGTVLDFQNILTAPSNYISFECFLPTYTATAWYHKKLPADLQRLILDQVVQQARTFAFGITWPRWRRESRSRRRIGTPWRSRSRASRASRRATS